MLTFSLYSVCQDRLGGLVEDRSPRMQEIGVQSIITALQPNARQQERASRVLRDDHHKRLARETVGVVH